MHRRRVGAAAAIAGALGTALIAISACGTTTGSSAATADPCPGSAPPLARPAIGTAAPILPPGAATAAICQYAPSPGGSKASEAPLRRVVLHGLAADGLRVVLNSADPLTEQAARCARAASLLPFMQVIYFDYRGGRTVRAEVRFTSCDLAVVTAAGRFGSLASPVQDDLFGYTLLGRHDRGPVAPDVIGLPAVRAAIAATRHHFALTVDAQAVDPVVPFGTVIFQVLPAGAPDAGPSPHSVGTVVAVRNAPDCQADQLGVTYRAGGAGAGNDFGEIIFRDVAGAPCRLAGRIQVTGVSAAGRPVTSTAAATVAAPGILGPDGQPLADLAAPPPDTMIYAWTLTGEYRDDPTSPSGLCTQRVIPARWRIVLAGRSAVTVVNADSRSPFRQFGHATGLVTCRGRLGGQTRATFVG